MIDKLSLIYEAAMAMGYDAVKTRIPGDVESMVVRVTDMTSVVVDLDPAEFDGSTLEQARVWVEDRVERSTPADDTHDLDEPVVTELGLGAHGEDGPIEDEPVDESSGGNVIHPARGRKRKR